MIYIILLLLKIGLFMNITNVENNKIFVFFLSSLVIVSIYLIIMYRDRKSKKRKLFNYYLLFSTILFIDVLHYAYFNRLPTVNMLGQAGQVTAVTDTLKQILQFKNLLMVLDIPILIFLKRKDKIKDFTIKTIKVPILSLGILVVYLVVLNSTGILNAISNQELFSYHIKDIRNVFTDDNILEAAEETKLEAFVLDGQEKARLKDGKYTGVAKGKNLIVIQVESLQDFVIGDVYEGQEVTPNLNKLIKEKGSLYFDNFYQSNGAGNTSDAEFVCNNSFHASMEAPSYSKYEQNTFYGLPHLLKDQGYSTAAFHGFKKEFWNREKAYVNQGFDKFIGLEDYDDTEKLEFGFSKIGFGLTDGEFFKQTVPYLKEMSNKGNPFYSFLVTLTSHAPYEMPEDMIEIKLRKEHEGTLFGNYLQSINYTDRAIGEFIDYLKEEGLYEDSVIALYGDHFALNSEADSNREILSDYQGKAYDLDEMMRIPCIIHVPGGDFNETISKVGSHLDFYPTIQNIMGYDNEKGMVLGVDLVNFEGENIAIPQNYAMRGTFVTDKEMFKMSRDVVFENSHVYDKKTQKKLDPKDFKKVYDKVIEELNFSDYILKNNILDSIIRGESVSKSLDTSGLDLPKEFIDLEGDPGKIDDYYSQGARAFKIDLQELGDEGVLLSTGEHFYSVIEKMMEYDDIYIMADLRGMEAIKSSKLITRMGTSYIDYSDRLSVMVDAMAGSSGLEVVYSLGKDTSLSQLKDIVKTYPNLNYISFEETGLSSSELGKLEKLGFRIFVEKSNMHHKSIYGYIR